MLFYILVEALLALVASVIYWALKRAMNSKNTAIAQRIQPFSAVLLSLLLYTWLFFSLVLLPWDSYLQSTVMLIWQTTEHAAAAAISDDVKFIHYYGGKFFITGYTLLFCWLIFVILKKWEGDVQKSQGASIDFKSALDTLFMIVRGAIYLVIVFILMRVWDLNHLADGLFTIGGVGAVFVSFAARDSIANIFGGVMILFDRPFRIGDYIKSPDRDIEGTVERIGWRVTQVRTPMKSVKYIPNSMFSTVSIENVTRMSNRRIRLSIGLRYADLNKVKKISHQLELKIDDLDFVDKRMSNFCTFNSLGDFSVDLLLNVYTKPLSYREYNKGIEELLQTVVKIVKKNEADFPFPTTTLDGKELVGLFKEYIDQ